MTYQQLLDLITNLGNDVSNTHEQDGILFITLDDFDGFDKNWNELPRDYDNPELVDELEGFLEEECEYVSSFECGGFYGYYLVDGHKINLCYTSDDI